MVISSKKIYFYGHYFVIDSLSTDSYDDQKVRTAVIHFSILELFY